MTKKIILQSITFILLMILISCSDSDPTVPPDLNNGCGDATWKEISEDGISISGCFTWNETIDKSLADLGTKYDSSVSVKKQGTGEGKGLWIRVFKGNANIDWWGAKSGKEHVETTTFAFNLAKNYDQSIALNKNSNYFLSIDQTLNIKWENLIGENSTITFLSDIEGNGINFTHIKKIDNTTFDGNDHTFSKSRDAFMVNIKSENVLIEYCSFINIKGGSGYQYALGIDWNTNSTVDNTKFKNIRTHTNSKNTSGFTGGIFITDDQSYRIERATLKASIHKITNSTFEAIYTLRQENGTLIYPDSDGIRNYSYGFNAGKYKGQELENLKNTQFIIDNCSFKNVLKSGLKLNYSTINVSNTEFLIDNLYEQTGDNCEGRWCGNVYNGFRFQSGPANVTLNNIKVIGDNIRFGILYTGTGNLKGTDIIYQSTFPEGKAFFLGGNKEKYSNNIDLNKVSSNKGLAFLKNIKKLTFNNVDNTSSNATNLFTFLSSIHSVPYLIHDINISNSTLKGDLKLYNKNIIPTFNNINITNTTGITASDIFNIN